MTGFLVAGLLFFTVVWLYYDRRDRLFYDRQRLRHVYHCLKCDHLYTSARQGVVNCPSCGFENSSLRF